ncbi:uncharacterized protein LOC119178401 isoform X2 [Rhipicephalus microplus]|uniref:uncharacterized protein LOC119178401 isoform X2 n=1 Tax=Rhipicephalus microplus TaxID=6941 RepID=UPI003F6C2C46
MLQLEWDEETRWTRTARCSLAGDMLFLTSLLCAHGARALRPYEPLDEDSNSGIPAVHAAPAFEDEKNPQDDVPTQEDDMDDMMENGNMPLTRQQSYHFSYQIRDSDGNSQHHSEQSDVRNNRRGSYGYQDANGVYRHVEYVADKKGFRAWIKTNEPGTTNQEPASVRITAEMPPAKVVDEATSPPAKPNTVADRVGAMPARPAVSAVPAFTQHDTFPVYPVHTAGGVGARPAVAAVPAFHVSDAGEYELSRTAAPVPAIDIATGTYPSFDSKRLSGSGYAPSDYSRQDAVPVQDHQGVPDAGIADFVYYPEQQRIHNYADKYGAQGYAHYPRPSYSNQAVPNAVPLYKSIRQFPTLSSKKGTEDSGEVTQKHGIPVGVTYVNAQDVIRPFERPQSYDIAMTGVASRYKRYLQWNGRGNLRD